MRTTYREIKIDMLRRITGGDWPPGGALPNESALADEYGVARATVNRAMRELAEEGLIERRRRAGSRVRPAPERRARFEIPLVRREIEAQGAAYGYALLRSELRKAPTWLRARLRLAAGTPVRHLWCLHRADGRPYQFEDRWISLAALPAAREADFSATGPNEWLVATVPYSEAEIAISAAAADAAAAGALGCGAGTALLQIERSTWWQGQAITHVRLLFRPGHRMTTRY